MEPWDSFMLYSAYIPYAGDPLSSRGLVGSSFPGGDAGEVAPCITQCNDLFIVYYYYSYIYTIFYSYFTLQFPWILSLPTILSRPRLY